MSQCPCTSADTPVRVQLAHAEMVRTSQQAVKWILHLLYLRVIAQELERGLDTILDVYDNSAGQEHGDVQGPSAPQPAAAKKKAPRPSKKPRGAGSSQGRAPCYV